MKSKESMITGHPFNQVNRTDKKEIIEVVLDDISTIISNDISTKEEDNLDPEKAKIELFKFMDNIEIQGISSSKKAKTIEQITQLLRSFSKTKNPKAYQIFRRDEHFQKLNIISKYLIENSLDRDLHAKITAYFKSIGIEISEEEQLEIIKYFKEKDDFKKYSTLNSYAKHGLLTLKSTIEKDVLCESSSTPGDFSSPQDLQEEFLTENHKNIRGYEINIQNLDDELFYGRNSFFQVVLERGNEEIDRASKLPKEEVENRARNSMIFVIKSDKINISKRADNDNKEDIVQRDITPDEIDYIIVDNSNLSRVQKTFGHLPCNIIGVNTIQAELLNFYDGPHKLPDYKNEIKKIVNNGQQVWCHIARLPVETYL